MAWALGAHCSHGFPSFRVSPDRTSITSRKKKKRRLLEKERRHLLKNVANVGGFYRVHPRVPSGLCSLSFSSFFSIRQRELTPILTIKFIEMRFTI